jgi:hypothetical protein
MPRAAVSEMLAHAAKEAGEQRVEVGKRLR